MAAGSREYRKRLFELFFCFTHLPRAPDCRKPHKTNQSNPGTQQIDLVPITSPALWFSLLPILLAPRPPSPPLYTSGNVTERFDITSGGMISSNSFYPVFPISFLSATAASRWVTPNNTPSYGAAQHGSMHDSDPSSSFSLRATTSTLQMKEQAIPS